jgi:hypothetical protein
MGNNILGIGVCVGGIEVLVGVKVGENGEGVEEDSRGPGVHPFISDNTRKIVRKNNKIFFIVSYS